MDAEKTMVSSNITSSLFTSIPTSDAITAIRRKLEESHTRSGLNPDQFCSLPDPNNFKYRRDFYREKGGKGRKKALNHFPGTSLTYWFRYVDTWVKPNTISIGEEELGGWRSQQQTVIEI